MNTDVSVVNNVNEYLHNIFKVWLVYFIFFIGQPSKAVISFYMLQSLISHRGDAKQWEVGGDSFSHWYRASVTWYDRLKIDPVLYKSNQVHGTLESQIHNMCRRENWYISTLSGLLINTLAKQLVHLYIDHSCHPPLYRSK